MFFFVFTVDFFGVKVYNIDNAVERVPIKVQKNGELRFKNELHGRFVQGRGGFSVRACWYI